MLERMIYSRKQKVSSPIERKRQNIYYTGKQNICVVAVINKQ